MDRLRLFSLAARTPLVRLLARSVVPCSPPAGQPYALTLLSGPEAADGLEEQWLTMGGGPAVRNVVTSTLTPFLPDPARATGAAVIVAPGGGFQMLSMQDEGWAVGRWLADNGIAAFVLKYRLNETPRDHVAFVRHVLVGLEQLRDRERPPPIHEPRATNDVLAALDVVHENAESFGVDVSRTGFLGFSAGAMAVLDAVREAQPEQRPAFVGYVYGPMHHVEDVPVGAPPMFAAIARDDTLFDVPEPGIVDAWTRADVPAELRLYEAGGHGFGLGKAGTDSTDMPGHFLAWLHQRGFTDANDDPSAAARPGASEMEV